MKRRKYGKQLTADKRSRSVQSPRSKFVPPRTLEEFLAMSGGKQDLWNDVGQIVTEMRKDSSLRQASRKFGRDERTIQRLARPALRKLRNGRWAAKTHDRLLRVLVIPTLEGLREIGLRDSRQATLLAGYWNAIERYLETGDSSGLSDFEGKNVTDADGQQFPLITDRKELDRLASAGVLSFESIYARAA